MIDPMNENVLDVYGGGQLLAFSALDGPTDYDKGLVARTRFDDVGLSLVLPARAELRFGGKPLRTTLAGDFLEIETDAGLTRAAFLDAHHLRVDGPCEVLSAGDGIELATRDGRTLVAPAGLIDPDKLDAPLQAALIDRRAWLEARELPGGLSPLRRRALVKALSQMKTQVCSPRGAIAHRWTTPDRWPHRAMWLWDSAFHAIGFRHVDVALAREMILAVLDSQAGDGKISHMISPDGVSSITQPPVLALGVMMVDRIETDDDWLAEVYPRLSAYVQWDINHRSLEPSGLPGWNTSDNANNKCDESGMDNSTRFEVPGPLEAVDFASYLALECEILAHLAHTLDRPVESGEWTERYLALSDAINRRMWDDRQGIYVDCVAATGEKTGVMSSAGFLPLICGAASPRQAQRLAEHLDNPDTFGTPLPVASIAAGDSEHYSKDMWRGPVWVNINWLIAYGFERSGLDDVASRIRHATLDELERCYEQFGTFFEFYDDRRETDPPELPRKGVNDPSNPFHQVIFDYGWSATLFADLVFTQ